MDTYTTVTETLTALHNEGYILDFNLKPDCVECGSLDIKLYPNDFVIDKFYRFEGASNPDDNAIIYAISSKGGLKGALVDAYGVYMRPLNGVLNKTLAVIKSNNIEIVTKGNGRLYYSWKAEGISTTGAYKQEDNYLKVRRTFYDRYGRESTGNVFKQNDLIIVGITLEKAFSGDVDNVVVTDLLPAGLEIENPRTKEIPGMDWIKNAAEPTALDVRDDRIHFFVNARNMRQTYYYAVRAVSLGQYKMGPISANAMYNGEYHSYHGAGKVKVVD